MIIEYVLSLVISFFGVVTGGVLALIAPEELKAGEKYLKILEWAILAVIAAFLIYISKINIMAIALSAAFFALKIFKKEYPTLAFILPLSYFYNQLFIGSTLVFLYGMPKGTLDAKEKVNIRNAKKQMVKTIFMVAGKNILFLLLGLLALPLLIAQA